MTSIAFSPKIGPVPVDVVLDEDHYASIEITANPIETGAEVNDHAYIKPDELVFNVVDSNAANTYASLKAFQRTRVPFTIVSGLSIYSNMLVQSINPQRDKDSDSIFSGTVVMREVKITSTATAESTSSGNTQGKVGGEKSRRATSPTSGKVRQQETVVTDRAAGTVSRGDSPATTVPVDTSQSILSKVFT